ncbi:MAG: NAD(P)-dependent oxidoreductase [Cyanothece sp. SIO1E1]|nr:NAD(P)-dependent oxidoreductase [Cyanothece sp. SIO1E1]
MSQRIFVTGASGCIGHYIAEALIQETTHELFLLVRNPAKLGFDYNARSGITILSDDLRHIERHRDLLKTIDTAVLAATSWGGAEEVFDINVVKTIQLMNLLDPKVCQQVIYFSTASILGRNNQPLKEAGELGSDYIRTKYNCFQQLPKLAIAPQITTLFPTLVFGGDAQKPYSHLSSGLPEITKWIKLARFFRADGSFHFIHGRDIAQVVHHLINHPPQSDQPRQLVLGNPSMSVNQAVEEICTYLHQRIYFRIPLALWLANVFINLFRIQMAAWDRFCLSYRHFTYEGPVNPLTLGLSPYCASLSDVLAAGGISGG